ncbi:MAG: SLC13 family permease [Microbacterium sp.]
MEPASWTFLILAAAVIAFVSGRVPLAVVAVGVSIALWATGVLTLTEAFAGFGDPTVLFIAALFVVSEALDAAGVTAWLGHQVVTRAGRGRRRLTVIIGALAAVLAAFISINGAVAALVPVVVVVAVRAGIAPSKMLVPLAFAASARSLLTLTGTPVNIVVSEAAVAAGGHAFGFFEFALAGVPLVILTVAVVALAGDRLLPARNAEHLGELAPDPREHAQLLRDSYDVDLATGALILLRVPTVPQTYRAISWTTVILIAGMVPLSAAFVSTGAAGIVADAVLGAIGTASAHLALLVLCVLTMVLGRFVSNVATVLIVTPIAAAISQTLELSVQPFMMALTVAGAAAFLTPVATPANLMVLQPGGYRFGDHWRLGLPLMVVFLAVAVLYVPLIWPF